MKLKVIMICIICISFLVACNQDNKLENKIIPSSEKDLVTGNIIFRAYNNLEDVSIVIIDSKGEVVEVLMTNKQGEAQKEITVEPDSKYISPKYEDIMQNRGTITAVAYKEGYRSIVMFEVPVKEIAVQPFKMYLELPDERNEPIGMLGNVHHLEINTLVEKYAKYYK